MKRGFRYLIVMALVLSFVLSACGKKQTKNVETRDKEQAAVSKEAIVDEKVDQKFLDDVSKALVARWEITDSKEYKDKMAELRESESIEEREMWRDFVNAELDIMVAGNYENASFEDEKLKTYALDYIQSLEEGMEATTYVTSDYDKFYDGWDAAYEKRIIILAGLVNDYGLSVEEDFQANLDELVANAYELQNNTSDTLAETQFKDNVYTCSRYTIKITDYKVIAAGQSGNEYGDKPVIAFWYDVTNISDDDLNPSSAWISVFSAYQDNDPNMLNELHIGMLPDEQYIDTQIAEIKVGGTVSSAISYTLSDETTSVTLAAEGILGEEYGSQDFEIEGR